MQNGGDTKSIRIGIAPVEAAGCLGSKPSINGTDGAVWESTGKEIGIPRLLAHKLAERCLVFAADQLGRIAFPILPVHGFHFHEVGPVQGGGFPLPVELVYPVEFPAVFTVDHWPKQHRSDGQAVMVNMKIFKQLVFVVIQVGIAKGEFQPAKQEGAEFTLAQGLAALEKLGAKLGHRYRFGIVEQVLQGLGQLKTTVGGIAGGTGAQPTQFFGILGKIIDQVTQSWEGEAKAVEQDRVLFVLTAFGPVFERVSKRFFDSRQPEWFAVLPQKMVKMEPNLFVVADPDRLYPKEPMEFLQLLTEKPGAELHGPAQFSGALVFSSNFF